MSKIKIFSLGGLNEVGKNMYIVDVDNDVFVFDAGLKYADDKMLGVDYIIPNYDYLKENQDRIKGIFITHGHEQQMGAVVDIINDIPNLKIYGTKFTLELLKEEFLQSGLNTDNLIELKPHRKVNFGKNAIFPISLTHAVPDTVGYVLYTLDGAIFYTGNFAFDPTMIGAYKTDIGKLAYVGKQGVLCLMSESLYADKKGFTSPNHRTGTYMQEILNRNEGRILFNIFEAQLYRIQELFNAIEKTERKVVIMGKRLENIIVRAIEEGYVKFDKSRIVNIHHVNDENVVVIISDEREKPFSNMKRILNGYDKFIKITQNDTVVFATQVYDGMEKSATAIFDRIAKLGSNLIILSTNKYLSLHASSEDLMLMLDLMQPKYYFPVIGEYRHQVSNSKLAKQIGMNDENVLLKLNGQVVTFENGVLVDTEETIKIDDILIDGKTVGDISEVVLKDREALADNGIVMVTVTLDKQTKQVLAGPEILTRGFIYVKDNIDIIKEIQNISLEVIKENTKEHYIDFNKAKMGIRDKVGKYLYQATECKPMILLVMQEV
ncbi:MAG: ribonuclease J [Firmicutes bacterium]|nr:ribonuclease J [Bacillota bacterium]